MRMTQPISEYVFKTIFTLAKSISLTENGIAIILPPKPAAI